MSNCPFFCLCFTKSGLTRHIVTCKQRTLPSIATNTLPVSLPPFTPTATSSSTNNPLPPHEQTTTNPPYGCAARPSATSASNTTSISQTNNTTNSKPYSSNNLLNGNQSESYSYPSQQDPAHDDEDFPIPDADPSPYHDPDESLHCDSPRDDEIPNARSFPTSPVMLAANSQASHSLPDPGGVPVDESPSPHAATNPGSNHGTPSANSNAIGNIPSTSDPNELVRYQLLRIRYDELSHSKIPESSDYKANLSLLHILQNTNGNKALYQKIQKWAYNQTNSGYSFPDRPTSYPRMIKEIEKRTGGQLLRPTQIPVTLPNSGVEVSITRYDSAAAMYRLLSDVDIFNDSTLTFPKDDPLAGPTPPDERDGGFVYSEIHHATNFHGAYQKYVEGVELNGRTAIPAFLLLGIDKAVIDPYSKLSVEPLKFTFSFFKQTVRNCPSAWACLGHIPNTINDITGSTPSENLADWHYCLSTLLDPLLEIQKAGGLYWDFKYKGIDYRTLLQLQIYMILGDSQGQQKIAGQYSGSKSLRQCYQCQIELKHLGDPYKKIKLTDGKKVSQLRKSGNKTGPT